VFLSRLGGGILSLLKESEREDMFFKTTQSIHVKTMAIYKHAYLTIYLKNLSLPFQSVWSV
jgi:hypothetical protein